MSALFGAGVASFALTDSNPLLQGPYQHDDFEHLAMTVREFGLPIARPLSHLVLAALADLGPQALYATLLGLVVLYPVLCVVFARRVLRLHLSRGELVLLCGLVAFGTFLFERSPETFRYTGHMTNALSTDLGMLAALVVVGSACTSIVRAVGAASLFALSLGAKEDFVLFLPAIAAIAAIDAAVARRWLDARRAAMLVAVLLAIGALAFLYNRVPANSVFVSSTGVYTADFAPLVLIRSAHRYLRCTPMARRVLVLCLVATVLVIARRRDLALRLGALWVLVLALIGPYAPLTRHFNALYAYNWLPLMLAGAALGGLAVLRALANAAARGALIVGAGVFLVVFAVVSHRARSDDAYDITARQERNRAITAELARYSHALLPYREVAIEGLDAYETPWFFGDGRYVNRLLGREVRWLFVAPPDSLVAREYRQWNRPLVNGSIVVVPPGCRCLLTVPRLRFAHDLGAELIERGQGATSWDAAATCCSGGNGAGFHVEVVDRTDLPKLPMLDDRRQFDRFAEVLR